MTEEAVGPQPTNVGHRSDAWHHSKADVARDYGDRYVHCMAKLRQTFHNPGEAPLFVNLELSTSRFRLDPGEELMLLYDPADRAVDDHGAVLRIELIQGVDGPELVIWTQEQEMFFPDGRTAPKDYGRA